MKLRIALTLILVTPNLFYGANSRRSIRQKYARSTENAMYNYYSCMDKAKSQAKHAECLSEALSKNIEASNLLRNEEEDYCEKRYPLAQDANLFQRYWPLSRYNKIYHANLKCFEQTLNYYQEQDASARSFILALRAHETYTKSKLNETV